MPSTLPRNNLSPLCFVETLADIYLLWLFAVAGFNGMPGQFNPGFFGGNQGGGNYGGNNQSGDWGNPHGTKRPRGE